MKRTIGKHILALAVTLGSLQVCVSIAWAVDPNFYKYSVRHEKGSSQFLPMATVENELVNAANGNVHFTIPLLSRPGRNGLGINLALSYNSKVWDHYVENNTVKATLAERNSWVGLGWTLLVARVIQAGGSYFVTLSDGSNHELFDYGSGTWRTRDSSYMIYKPADNKLILKGGLTLILGYVDYSDSTIRYATKVQDTNGNYVDITYKTGSTGAGGRIDKIEDTLGNTYTFALDANSRLAWINAPTNSIGFQYQTLPILNFLYEPMDPTLPTQYALTYLSVIPGSIYYFTYYDNSGLIQEITYPTCGKSYYQYGIQSVWDRPLGPSVYEWMVAYHNTGTGSPLWSWSYFGFPATQVGPSSVTINTPSSIWKYDMWIGSGGWSDCFLKIVREQTLQSLTISEARQYWTQDNETDPNVSNPRLSKLEKGLKPQGAGTDKVVTTEYSYALSSDLSGNVKETREYAFGQWGVPGPLRRKIEQSYLHETNGAYAALNIIDRLTSTLVRNGANDEISKSQTTYDQLALLSSSSNATRHDPAFGLSYTTRGLPNKISRWYNMASNPIDTTTQYDEFGNPRIATDGRNYSTTMNYGSSGSYAFPLQVINPKGHVTQATYNYVGGVILTQTDSNGKVTTTAYDPYFRLSLLTKPDGGTTSYTYYTGCNAYVSIVEAVTSTSSRTRTAKLDNMGRFQEKDVSDPVGGTICQTKQYNWMSQVSSLSLPFRDGQPVYSHTYQYSASRPLSITLAAGGTIGYSYDLDMTTVTNTDNKKRRYTYQEDAKVSQVTEEDSSSQLTACTTYEYDTLNNLKKITQGGTIVNGICQPGPQTRTFTYDALGRLITEKHPESSAAGNSYSYTYDANSNILTKTDARGTYGIKTTFTYDELNRVTLKEYDDLTTPSVTYFYDSQPAGSPISIQNPIGRITKITTTTGGVTATNYFSYCNCSAVSQEATVIQDGTTRTYITSYSYNYVGGITSMTYPNGRVVNYTRDSVGRETRVYSLLDGWNPIDYVRSAKYLGPQGGLTEIEHGFQNGVGYYVKTNVTYSPTTMRLTNLQTFGLNLNFRYEVPGMPGKYTGHIYDIDDAYDPQTGPYNRHFEYDRWYRLTKWWIYPDRTATPATIWNYDNYGNVTSRIYSGGTPTNYTIDASTNRLLGPGSYAYDEAGNMTGAPGGVTRSFDAENRITSTSQGGLSFLYDGSGRRLRKMLGTTKIYFVYSSTGKLLVEDNWTASTAKDHIYFNGQLIATRDQADIVRLFFKDHLGSTRSVVKVNPPTGGQAWGLDWMTAEVHNYYPYGDVYSSYFDDPAQQVTQKFTGQKRDSESNLDYFGARNYDSGYGTQWNPRWISADPIMSRPTDLRSLNKYAYTGGDPVNFIDPQGLDRIEVQSLLGGQLICVWLITDEGDRQLITCTFGVTESQAVGGAGGVAPGRRAQLEQQYRGIEEDAYRITADLANRFASGDISQDCKNDLSALGITARQFAERLSDVQFNNGFGSQVPLYQLLRPGTDEYRVAQERNLLVGHSFGQHSANRAIASLNGPDVWLSPVHIRPGEWARNAATIAHETLHTLNKTDEEIQRALFGATSPEVGRPSSNISDRLLRSCFQGYREPR